MAFTEFYCNPTTGSNLNAGSTEAGAASLTYASGSWVQSTGVFTPASGDPVADGVAVGDFASVYPDAATVTPFVGRVTARDTTTITVSLTAKSGTAPVDGTANTTLKIGGTWKGPNAAEGFPFNFSASTMTDAAGNKVRVNFKNNAQYAITAAISDALTTVVFQGYSATPGDGGKAIIDGGTAGASYVLLTCSGTPRVLIDFVLQNNGATGNATGVVWSGGRGLIKRIVVHDLRGVGLDITGTGNAPVDIEAYACNQSNSASLGGMRCSTPATVVRPVCHHNAGSNSSGLIFNSNTAPYGLVKPILDSNGSHGLSVSGTTGVVGNGGVFNGNGGSGISMNAGSAAEIENAIFQGNGAYGVNVTTASGFLAYLHNCAFRGNTSGETNGVQQEDGSITLTADPFVDAANGDFRLNTTAGGGADCRGAGFESFTQTAASYAGSVGYLDIGAVQHADPAGGGGMLVHPGMSGGLRG